MQIEADNRAASAAKEGLARKLKEAETRSDMLAGQVSDLQASLERQRAAADQRWLPHPIPALGNLLQKQQWVYVIAQTQ